MSDAFKDRLESAIARGVARGQRAASAAKAAAISEEELRQRHTAYRLSLSEKIEQAIAQVADHFPGFRIESLFGSEGWGSACYRDDLKLDGGRRKNLYSRLEMAIRPASDAGVLDLKGKATVVNRELFNRSHFVKVAEVEEPEFASLIDAWAIEFAENYASRS